MRIELDANGYVLNTYWGCYSGECIEYKGAIPSGYESYADWNTNALISAYYLEDGDLKLDSIKLTELEAKIEQEAIDNEPVLRKDLYGSTDTLNNQYISAIAQGETLSIDNVKKLNPKIKITDIESFVDNKIDIITQARNMLRNDGISEKINGVKFTKNIDGSITINGTATKDIEYNLSGNSTNTDPLFALKKNIDYYFNIDGLDCEMKYYDGTTSQVYVGASGKINLNESKAVTQVLIKIPTGTKVNKKIYPMLEYGTSASPYEEYKSRKLTIDLSEYTKDMFYPDEDIYPDEDLFPTGVNEIEYITIEDGRIKAYIDGKLLYIAKGNVNLFDGYNNVYTSQNAYLEMKYYTNLLDVESLEFLQGKATTTNQFKILEDGSIEAHNGYFSGKITSESGNVGGCTIDDAGIYSGSGNTTAGVGVYGPRYAFWAGSSPDNSVNAPFRVGHDGSLRSSNADITGNITANSGTFNGTVNASGGNIGGFTLDGDKVYMGDTGMSSNGGRHAFWAGETNGQCGSGSTDAPFRVGHNGYLTATNATITGDITANSGTFNGTINAGGGSIGNWSISGGGLTGSSGGYSVSLTPAYLSAKAPGDTWEQIRWYSIVFDLSDRNIKNNIQELENKYDVLFDNLKPVSFKYNDEYEEEDLRHIGFIAQDFQEAEKLAGLNDLATVHGKKILKLDKQEIIALNTWQIQKLKNQVKEQQEMLEQLREEINLLKESDK